jgi:hypothetical protein
MAIINPVNGMLHRIRVKLYPNYLPHVGGPYIARTDNEASLTMEEVCAEKLYLVVDGQMYNSGFTYRASLHQMRYIIKRYK